MILKNSLIKILEIFRLRKGGKIKEINKLLVPNYRDKNKEKKLESDRDKLNNNEKEKKIYGVIKMHVTICYIDII